MLLPMSTSAMSIDRISHAVPESSPRSSTYLEMLSGFSSTSLWVSDDPIDETVPSPTRAMTVSSPAPPTRRSMLARTVTRATATLDQWKDVDYGPLPIEAIAFADAGFLWTRGSEAVERDRFRSVGAGARVNIGGFVFEVAGARPFDRAAGNGWTLSFLMRPGW